MASGSGVFKNSSLPGMVDYQPTNHIRSHKKPLEDDTIPWNTKKPRLTTPSKRSVDQSDSDNDDFSDEKYADGRMNNENRDHGHDNDSDSDSEDHEIDVIEDQKTIDTKLKRSAITSAYMKIKLHTGWSLWMVHPVNNGHPEGIPPNR